MAAGETATFQEADVSEQDIVVEKLRADVERLRDDRADLQGASDPERIAWSEDITITEDTCHGHETRTVVAIDDEQLDILAAIVVALRAEMERGVK